MPVAVMEIGQTAATKKEYGVIQERSFWFDKKGMREVPNEEYVELKKERRDLMIEDEKRLLAARKDQLAATVTVGTIVPNFNDMEELQEAQRVLRKDKEAAYLERVAEHGQSIERGLEKEKRKIRRDLEGALLTKKRDYRSFLRELDALKIAQERIVQYTEEQDQSLAEAQKQLNERKQMMEQSTNEQMRISEVVEKIEQAISKENTSIQIEII